MVAVDRDGLFSAYEAVRDDKTEEEWALFGYDDSNTVVHLKSGSQYDDFLTELKDEERCYAYLRIQSGDELSKRAKFVFVAWIGENVSGMKKAKVGTDKSSVKAVLKNFAIEISTGEKHELELEEVRAAVRKAGGANYGTGQ
ncbi:coactosin-like protein [Exaiptasia diaphana]|uniref:Coactosin-like protein n=1 Tax=Exaiptasia diaphana TaxID=2652724 RepID=A0A913WRA1_EXADI|nr:coactosin-like protein [Exaiptasia diaphana]KXJ18508.1 Coactosin-like protein [Exaiptasia diaphana]